jgi:hypothetical protein
MDRAANRHCLAWRPLRLVIIVFLSATEVLSLNKLLAKTPRMGWNSYDAYHGAITEEQFRPVVDILAKKYLPFGYEYAVIDYCWFNPGPVGWNPIHWRPFPVNQTWNEDGSFSPHLAMDQFGRFLPALNRFPSASGGKGFKIIADYVHSKRMKFGIHIIVAFHARQFQRTLRFWARSIMPRISSSSP